MLDFELFFLIVVSNKDAKVNKLESKTITWNEHFKLQYDFFYIWKHFVSS